jgi:hypothetical protein
MTTGTDNPLTRALDDINHLICQQQLFKRNVEWVRARTRTALLWAQDQERKYKELVDRLTNEIAI